MMLPRRALTDFIALSNVLSTPSRAVHVCVNTTQKRNALVFLQQLKYHACHCIKSLLISYHMSIFNAGDYSSSLKGF